MRITANQLNNQQTIDAKRDRELHIACELPSSPACTDKINEMVQFQQEYLDAGGLASFNDDITGTVKAENNELINLLYQDETLTENPTPYNSVVKSKLTDTFDKRVTVRSSLSYYRLLQPRADSFGTKWQNTSQ